MYEVFQDVRAFLYTDELGMQDLNDLLLPSDRAEWTLHRAFGINDVGQITGSGVIGGQSHAFLLSPISLRDTP